MIIQSQRPFRIGVIADTHIPDRVGALHPDVIPTFKQMQVQLILHAGDVSSPAVIESLQTVAECRAVKGNRDWKSLPVTKSIEFIKIIDIAIALLHGHGGLFSYIIDKFPYYLFGYQFKRYPHKLARYAGDAKIIIFGHTHHAENQWVNGKLYFNPGSAYEGKAPYTSATIGLIEIDENQYIKGRIIPLRNATWSKKGWILQEI